MSAKASFMKFPCEFPIKVMGYASDEFEKVVKTIVFDFDDKLNVDAFSQKLSKDGKYLSITVNVYANSKEALDGLYWDLNANEHVLVTL